MAKAKFDRTKTHCNIGMTTGKIADIESQISSMQTTIQNLQALETRLFLNFFFHHYLLAEAFYAVVRAPNLLCGAAITGFATLR